MPRMQLRLLSFQLHVKLAGPSCIPKFCQWLTLQNRQTLFSYMEEKEECFLSWKQIFEDSSWEIIWGTDQWSSWAKPMTHCNWRKRLWCSYIFSLLTHLLTFLQLSGAHQTSHWANSIHQPGRNLYGKRIKANCFLLDLQLNWLSEGFAKSQNWSKGGHPPDHTAKNREGEKKNQDPFR